MGSIPKSPSPELLSRHGLTMADLEKAGVEWATLREIAEHHDAARGELQVDAEHVARRLQGVAGVHSLKWRVKDTEHLVAKMVRKTLEQPTLKFTVDSYECQVTDLIGLRALHLLKQEWREIHHHVVSNWELHEQPVAYVRDGDPAELLAGFREAELDVKEHPFGYRSVHYLLKFSPTKKARIAELQVRTIFEEGWSEIDHQVRYPRRSDDPSLAQFLAIFNRLAGSADEMGAFVTHLHKQSLKHAKEREDGDKRVQEAEANLRKAVASLRINQEEKSKLEKMVESLERERERAVRREGLASVADYPLTASMVGMLSRIPTSATIQLPEAAKHLLDFQAATISAPSSLDGLTCKKCGKVSLGMTDGLCSSCLAGGVGLTFVSKA